MINVQSRYIGVTPYCHAFLWSGIKVEFSGAYVINTVNMFGKLSYDGTKKLDYKWELDSLVSF